MLGEGHSQWRSEGPALARTAGPAGGPRTAGPAGLATAGSPRGWRRRGPPGRSSRRNPLARGGPKQVVGESPENRRYATEHSSHPEPLLSMGSGRAPFYSNDASSLKALSYWTTQYERSNTLQITCCRGYAMCILDGYHRVSSPLVLYSIIILLLLTFC